MFLLPQFALSLGWSSGSGKIYKDDNNPWFLENTERVFYCVAQDPIHFPVDPVRAKALVREAITSWTYAFRLAQEEDRYSDDGIEPYGTIRLGTQEFIERDCSFPNLDLRFQLGKLTDQQAEMFQNPQDYIGLAARTSYSRENLKGQGFIYIAPVSGKLKPDLDQLHPEAWNYLDHFAFKIVLRHEIGHLFGLPHKQNSLMDEKTPEMIVGKELVEFLVEEYDIEIRKHFSPMRFLGLETNFEKHGCAGKNPVHELSYFGVEYDEDDTYKKWCGKVVLDDNHFSIYLKKNEPQASYKKVGYAYFNGTSTHSGQASEVYLTKKQKVFTKFSDELSVFNSIGASNLIKERVKTGTLQIYHDGKSYPLRITINAEEGSGLIVDEGKFVNDMFDVK